MKQLKKELQKANVNLRLAFGLELTRWQKIKRFFSRGK